MFVSNHENVVFDAWEYTPLWFVRKSALERDMMKALRKYFEMTVKTQLRYRMPDGFGLREAAQRLKMPRAAAVSCMEDFCCRARAAIG